MPGLDSPQKESIQIPESIGIRDFIVWFVTSWTWILSARSNQFPGSSDSKPAAAAGREKDEAIDEYTCQVE